jgi:DNA-binding NtrC family response regulator
VIAARATQDQETAKVPHVLIVEDDPDVLQMMEDVLRLEGYSTETARNGAEAPVSRTPRPDDAGHGRVDISQAPARGPRDF